MCANITWDTPLFDGAAPILNISLVYIPTSNMSHVQSVRTSSGSDTTLEICDLVPNEIYYANISALNSAGRSEEVEFIILINAFGMLN